ncbi:MAG TPA: hypothetical protein VEK15_06335 [Vicinamibacteria bacterium]|nr:hypothetical protein [Vicinamibacteria bacterium]
MAFLVSCGKRGDPLPPLRPVPGIAEAVSVSQEGTRIRLRWTAPTRNDDGTVEQFDIERAILLRREIDLEALVAEQTTLAEPPQARPTVDPAGEATDQPQLGPSSQPTEAAPAEPVPAAPVQEPVEVQPAEAPEVEPPGAVPPAPPGPSPPPRLVIPPFAAGATEVATIESTQPGGVVTYEEEIDPAWIGQRLEYAMVYENRKGRRSPFSAVAQIEPRSPLEPPSTVDVSSGDGFVKIRWSKADSIDESMGFAVFRRGELDATYPERPLNATPLRETELLDESALFGTPWCYIVRTVLAPKEIPAETAGTEGLVPDDEVALSSPNANVDSAGPTGSTAIPSAVPEAETATSTSLDDVVVPVVPPLGNPVSIWSLPSPESCLVPEDLFAPEAPADVVAVVSTEGILLTWRIVDARDLAGYKVYRASSPDGPFELVGEAVMGSFSDTEAERGGTFYYAVTAVDDAPAANESPRSPLAEVTRP